MAGKKKKGGKAKGKKPSTGSPTTAAAGVSAPTAQDLTTSEQGVAPAEQDIDISTSNASDVAMPETPAKQPVGAVPDTAARQEIVEEEEGQKKPEPEAKPEPETKPEPKLEPKPEPEAKPEPKPEPKAKPEPKPEPTREGAVVEEATPSEVPPAAETGTPTKVFEHISPASAAARKAAQLESKNPFITPASIAADAAAAEEAAATATYLRTTEPRASMAWAPVEPVRPAAAVKMAPAPQQPSPAPQQPSPAQRQTQAIAESDAQNGPGAPAVAASNSAEDEDCPESEHESHEQSQSTWRSAAHLQSSKEPRGRQPAPNNKPLPTNAAPVSPAQVPLPQSHNQQATTSRDEPSPESIPPPYSAYPVPGNFPSSEPESQDLSDLAPDSSNKSPHSRENIELSNLHPNGKDAGSLEPETRASPQGAQHSPPQSPALAKTTEGGVRSQIPFLGYNGKSRASSQEPKMPSHPVITKKRLNISDEQLVGARPSVVTGVPSGTDFTAMAAAGASGKVPPYYTAETEGLDNVRLEYGIDQDVSRRRFASLSTPAPISMRVKNRLNAWIQYFKEMRTRNIVLIVACVIVVLGLVIGLGVGLTLREKNDGDKD